MPTPTLDTTPDGALVIEADTAAAALEEVRTRIGDDARIIDSRKVHRGGWKGFFALERVQLTVRHPDPSIHAVGAPHDGAARRSTPAVSEPRVAVPVAPVDGALGDGLTAVLERLMCEAEEAEGRTFRDVLLEQVAAQEPPPARPEVPRPEVPKARPEVPQARPEVPQARPEVPPARARATKLPSGVDWQLEHLRDLRLPASLISACRDLDPLDDGAWLAAISDAVVPWCRPLPPQDAAYVGPRAHRIGAGLGLPVTQKGGEPAATGTIALRVDDSVEGRRWAEKVSGDRWLHVVAGGPRWHALLFDDALAVSWVGAETLPIALSVVGQMGLVLGYGIGDVTGRDPVRATPLDIALTIRSLLPRR